MWPRATLRLLAALAAAIAAGCGADDGAGAPSGLDAHRSPSPDDEPAATSPPGGAPIPPLDRGPRIDTMVETVCWLPDEHSVRCVAPGEEPFVATFEDDTLVGLDLFHRLLCVWRASGPAMCWAMESGRWLPRGPARARGRDVAAMVEPGDSESVCWLERSGDLLCDGERATDAPAEAAHGNCVVQSGAVRCRGDARGGRLGPGCQASRCEGWVDVPVPEPIVAVATTWTGACALGASRRALYCWGGRHDAHLWCQGLAPGESVLDPPEGVRRYELPTPARSLRSVGLHLCAVLVDGDVHCLSTTGVVGSESSPLDHEPRRVLSGVVDIGQSDLPICALTTDGTVRCQSRRGPQRFELDEVIEPR